jgi:peptidoglycan hydrolase CwlO-like protein
VEEQLKSTEKQLADANEQVTGKDTQLNEMYDQIDSIQATNEQLETDLSLQKEFLEDK